MLRLPDRQTARPTVLRALFRTLYANRLLWVVLVSMLTAGLILKSSQARQTPRELVQQGDKSWAEQSYGLAEEAYRKALDADPKLPERPELEYRILVGLIRESKWDRAVVATEAYVKQYRDTLWEARAQVWRSRLYKLIDHSGYKVGEKIYRGSNVPKSDGKNQPEQVDLSAEDSKKADEAVKRARLLIDRFRNERIALEEKSRLTEAEIDLDFDLANEAMQTNDVERFDTEAVDWKIDLQEKYDPKWPSPKRVMYLYEQIVTLDEANPAGDHHPTVLARLGQAAFILQVRSWGGWNYPQGRGGRSNRPIYRTIPYAALDPIRLLEETLARYPQDREADRLAYTVALWTEQKNDLLHAVDAYTAFVSAYPKSRWVSDAHRQLDNLLQPSLGLNAPTNLRPGSRATVSLTTRNISVVKFAAYRVHPEALFGHVTYDVNHHPSFDDFDRYFYTPEEIAQYHREKVAEWTATTSNDGKHNLTNDSVTTPLDSAGAYIIEARAGDGDKLGANTLLIVSDLSLVQKVDRDSVLVYATDSKSGKPVANVKLTLWEPVNVTNDLDKEAVIANGVTDASGAFHDSLPPPKDLPAYSNQISRHAVVFAYAGNNRYALTNNASLYRDDLPVGEKIYRAFIYTDRPLYRPNQTVNYRVVMTKGTPGNYTLAANKEFNLVIGGPHGELLNKTIQTGSTGTVNDAFALPTGADLGEYAIYAYTPKALKLQSPFAYGSGSFRVEEYKKPEFTVGVQPEKTEVRVGEKMSVTVTAAYFFGAPVARAKVHYKVFRTPYVHPLPFHSKLEWYDSDGANRNQPSPDYSYWGDPSTAYREGDLTTDAKGEAKLIFPTDPPKPPKGYSTNPGLDTDQNYTITAEVTDDSRRQVTGMGVARASATQFHAYMQLDHKFILPGDTLQIEVKARDGGDKPFGTEGYITLWQQIPAIPEKDEKDPKTGKMRVVVPYVPAREEKDGMLFVKTDPTKDGSGLAFWHPDKAADYRLEFNSRDAWGHDITVNENILVYGPNFDSRLQKEDNRYEMLAEHDQYRPGETARFLIIAPKPDSYVLFTEQAIGAIQHYRTVFVPGRSSVVEAKIGAEHLPNARFEADLVRDGLARVVQAEVSVPAVDRILSLTVTPDKAEYKPGEHATFHLHAVGLDGKPVQGEISLGVVDEALLAIQPDTTPDIRAYFYGYQIQTNIAGAYSTQLSIVPHLFTLPMKAYDSHELIYPEDMGWLADRNPGNRQQLPGYVPYVVGTEEMRRRSLGKLDKDKDLADDQLTVLYAEGSSVFTTSVARYDMPVAAAQMPGSPGGKDGRVSHARQFGNYATDYDEKKAPSSGERSPQSPLAEAVVRKTFSDTAYWMPAVTTDADGNATVSFDFPDNITKWHITARGVTGDVKVGVVEGQSLTTKNLLVRLQAPRFFVDRDQVTLSANVHNYLASAKMARVELVVDGERFSADVAAGHASNSLVRTVQVEKDGEVRVDWTVKVLKPGLTKIKVIAQTDQESDAAELAFPVLVHGVEKFIANSGVLKNGGESSVTLDIPEMRRKGSSLLDVQMSPSLASVMLDALPYLEDYPYGCVEQTLSRFVPTVMVAKTLRDSGIDLETLGKRAAALEEQRKSIPPQQLYENSGYTYPKGVPGALDANEMASRLFLHGRSHAPIFDSKALQAMTDAGLTALYEQQRDDGSWGWWKGSAIGDPYLTAYALEGLLHARQADIAVKPEVIAKATAYLNAHLNSTEELNLLAYYSYVLSLEDKAAPGSDRYKLTDDFLYTRRDRMSPYGQALLALALHGMDEEEKAGVVVRNLVTSVKRDDDRGTAHWESADKYYWHWYNDKQETTAMVLRALVAIAPQDQLEPKNGPQAAQTGLAPMAVRWLVDNRRGGYWTSTRQTANVVEALLAYARAQKELMPDYTVTVDVDGKVARTFKIDRDNALLFDNRFLVGDEILASGGQKLHITMQGTGTLYWNAYLKYFDMSEPIQGVSNAIAVERKYYKIVSTVKKDKQGQSTTSEERVPLPDGASLVSGDIVEVELYLKSDNDYDYVVFEDMKPAGCEAVETRSGTTYADGLCSNFELRDEKVAFFLDTLPQGTKRITYKLRAEVPGSFHALPTNGYAMYAPDIRALSDEWRVNIADAPLTSGPSVPTTAHKKGRK